MELHFHLIRKQKSTRTRILTVNNFLVERNEHLVSLCFCQELAILGDLIIFNNYVIIV